MLPIGPMMIEHRLIEKMIAVMKKALVKAEEEKSVNPVFIEMAVDFIRTYADRCHHGKEEDILFRELSKKTLSAEHKRIMDELTAEHVWGRKTTGRLVEANARYAEGDQEALSTIFECMRALIDFYPKHILKEDKDFFIPVMDYFTDEEKDAMLEEGFEFDQNLIHQKYQDAVTRAEQLLLR
jgi:hemerythrin-like domain-containing protein